MSSSLAQMIEAVNGLSTSDADAAAENPMNAIQQILSSHLESLQWIDGAVRELDAKVGDVEQRVRAASDGGYGLAKSRSGFGLR